MWTHFPFGLTLPSSDGTLDPPLLRLRNGCQRSFSRLLPAPLLLPIWAACPIRSDATRVARCARGSAERESESRCARPVGGLGGAASAAPPPTLAPRQPRVLEIRPESYSMSCVS